MTLQFAFHMAVGSTAPAPVIVAVGTLLGVLSGWWYGTVGADVPPMTCALWSACAWLASSLLAVVARTAVSFTAVPVSHPLVADFEGARAAG